MIKIYKLDKIDKGILEILDKNACTSLAHIAHELGISKQLISYHLNKIEEKGVIYQYSAYIDRSRLGYFHYQLYLKLSKYFSTDYLHKTLLQIPNLHWVAQSKGEYNLIIYFLVNSLGECHLTYQKILQLFEGLVLEKELLLTSKGHYFNQSSIIYTEKEPRTFNEPQSPYKLKPRDYAIINTIKENARIKKNKLAKIVGLSEYTVRQRLNYLKRTQIIRRFRPKINYRILGYRHYQLPIHFKESILVTKQIIEGFLKQKEAFRVTETIGKWDVICDVVLPKDKNLSAWFKQAFGEKLVQKIPLKALEIKQVLPINTSVYHS